jgi:hypothetical protein
MYDENITFKIVIVLGLIFSFIKNIENNIANLLINSPEIELLFKCLALEFFL